MQTYEEHSESINEAVSGVSAQVAREESAVWQRVAQMFGNEDRFEWFTLLVAAPGHYADWFNAGDVEFA